MKNGCASAPNTKYAERMEFERVSGSKSDAKGQAAVVTAAKSCWQGFFLPYLGTAEAQQDIDNPTIKSLASFVFHQFESCRPVFHAFCGKCELSNSATNAKVFSHGVRQI
jgi:hypothetical protein